MIKFSRTTTSLLTGLLIGLAALPQMDSVARADAIQWQTSLSQAQSLARAEGKPLMIDFYTDWCVWCKKLDKTTYIDPAVVELSRSFVAVKLDAERAGKSAAAYYKVESFPHIVFTQPEGQLLHRLRGYLAAKPYAVQMQYALALFDETREPAPPSKVSTGLPTALAKFLPVRATGARDIALRL